ncbi:prepilin-type N-terminal cleavage/methylation domain-containing protein [Planctomycetales bacterium ZRK34]|nr:prepilin-type N-terminal cleavage/methylation domain-containing protein [Planctomycetales bacterium ZRK34]
MKRRHMTTRGFTMLEMLIAMAITIGIVLFINQVFSSVKDAVSSGIGLSRVIQNARVARAQMTEDARAMVKPSDEGFLMVVNKDMANVYMTPDAATPFAKVPSDQLCFARLRGDLEPVTPGKTDSISSTSDANHVKIWYGHALRLKDDGTDYTPLKPYLGPTSLNQADPNYYAINWIMGRQALFLDEGPNNPQQIYSYGAQTDMQIAGYTGEPASDVDDKLYMALTDVSGNVSASGPATLQDISNDLIVPANGGSGGPENAIKYTYVRADQRLRVNPYPVYKSEDADRQYGAWQLAQTHPYFVPNVTSIQVEVAADWFDKANNVEDQQDGLIDTDNQGGIIWYSEHHWNSAIKNRIKTYRASLGGDTQNADRLFLWTRDNQPKWPYLIRVTYRLTDEKGRVASQTGLGRMFEVILPVNRN